MQMALPSPAGGRGVIKGILMKVLLIDGHVLFREGLHHLLQQLSDGVVEILEAESFPEGLKLAGQHPDLSLALLELKSPGCEGALSVKHFRKFYAHFPLVVLSSEESPHVIKEVLSNGADGFVCKSSGGSTLLSALSSVLAGSVYVPKQLLHPTAIASDNEDSGSKDNNSNNKDYGLTSRQMEVLGYLSAGLSNKEIASAIHLAEGTVKVHVAGLYQSLRVKSRMEAIRVARQLGLVGMSHA